MEILDLHIVHSSLEETMSDPLYRNDPSIAEQNLVANP
jgi:hypothetical protein